MPENLGDLRGCPDVNIRSTHDSLATLGYVVLADSQQVDLEPGFRSEVLPQYRDLLQEDIYAVPPVNRRRVSGLVKYERQDDGSLKLVQDFAQVAIPVWSGNGFAEPRIYPNGLPVLASPMARKWLEGLATIALPRLPEAEGTIGIHYFETGHGDGRVVSGPHQDGELLVASYPDYINGEGAETTLFRPIAFSSANVEQSSLTRVATFRLGVGDIALSDDVELWHDVSPLQPPLDGSDPRRRSLVVAFHAPQTYQWLRDNYASGYLSSAPAS